MIDTLPFEHKDCHQGMFDKEWEIPEMILRWVSKDATNMYVQYM